MRYHVAEKWNFGPARYNSQQGWLDYEYVRCCTPTRYHGTRYVNIECVPGRCHWQPRRVQSAVWGMLYADDTGIISKSAEGLVKL